jgi:hypothetical protein
VHALLVVVVLSRAPRPRVAQDEPLAVELRDVVEAPPLPSVGPPLPSVGPPLPPVGPPLPSGPPRVGPSRSLGRRAATPSLSRSPTPPAPAESPATPSLLSMREAPDLRLPAPPPPERPRDELGLPSNPVPNVIHHPVGPPPLAGTHRDPSGLETKIGADGSITFRDPASVREVHGTVGPQGPGVGGKLDFNDTIERWAGNDPYAYQKRKIADATFEERLCLAQEDARRRGQEALFHLKDRLERVLHVPGLSLTDQRRTIFELWDECLDGKEDTAQSIGAAARATITAFIRRAFPPGTARAYPAAELAALNARRSSAVRFDPYGSQSGGGVRPL